MTTDFAPPQRLVPAGFYTRAGWLTGTLHIPEAGQLLASVERVEEFYKLTDVRFAGIDHFEAFFALQRDALVLIVPDDADDRIADAPADSRKELVSVLFDTGVVIGWLRLAARTRLSDYLQNRRGFIHLANCEIHIGQGESKSLHRPANVLVNVEGVIGISERRAASGDD